MAVKRKITSATDPKKGGSKVAAKPARTRKAKAPAAPAAAKPKRTRKAKAAPAAGAAKATRKPRTAKSSADKKLDKDRAKVMATRRGQAKGKSIQARLKVRLAKYSAGIKAAKKSQSQIRKLLLSRQKVARTNLVAKQKAAKTNLLARQKARLAQRIARKPTIQGNKIVTPKAKATKVKLVKATTKPLPRLKGGQQTTAKRTAHKGTAAQKAGAKRAARTRKKGTVEV